MTATFKKFDLITWSQSHAVTLRKLRAFAAPLGGRAHLVQDFGTVLKALGPISGESGHNLAPSLETPSGSPIRGSNFAVPLVLVDQDITMTPDQIQTLRSRCRLLLINRDGPARGHLPKVHANDRDWEPWMLASGPLPRLLESLVGRATMGWVAQSQVKLSLDLFFRWGYESHPWGSWNAALSKTAPRSIPSPSLLTIGDPPDGGPSAKILKKMGFGSKPSQAIAAVLDQAVSRLVTSHFDINDALVASDGLSIGAMARVTARGMANMDNLESLASKLASSFDLTIVTLRTSQKTGELVLLMPAPVTNAPRLVQASPLVIMLRHDDHAADLSLDLSTAV